MTLPAEFIEKYQKLLGKESNNFLKQLISKVRRAFV